MAEDIVVKKYQLYIAIISLLSTLLISVFGLFQMYQNSKKLGLIDIAISDTQELRKSLKKPLEGVFGYQANYDVFHGEKGPWQALGKAIFLWNPSKSSYDVFLAASLKDIESSQKDLLAWYFETEYKTDESGWPGLNEDSVILKLNYVHRTTSVERWESGKGAPQAIFNLVIDKESKNGLLVDKLKGEFFTISGNNKDSVLTHSNITFERID